MANKTIDKYSLSTSLNDEDLLLVAKYDSSTSKYTAYNKYKISASCGYAIRKKDEIISLKEVYKKADKNMYLNKRELKLASNNKEAISK